MATQVEKGVFTANTSTGDQDITLADSGLTPKLVILWASYDTAEGITNGDGIFSMGLATRDGGATQQGCIANFNDDAAGTSATVHDLNDSHVLRGITSDAIESTAIDYSCTLVSFGAGTFRINWDNAPASAIKIHYWVMGGSDVTAARLVKTTTSTAAATQNVTVAASWGQPDLLIFMSHGYTSLFSQNDARLMVGFAKSDTERAAFMHTFEDAAATMNLASWYRNDACMLFLGGSTSADAIVDISAKASWPTDGFQLAYDDQASLAFHFFALAIKGTFTCTIGTAEMQTAGGNQDLALASGTPKGALFVASEVPLTNGTIDTTHADLGGYCVGGTDGTHEGFAGMVDDDGNTTSRASRFHSESKALARHIADAAGGAAALDAEADSSISGSNIRLNWGNAPALAADYLYLLIGEAAGATTLEPGLTTHTREVYTAKVNPALAASFLTHTRQVYAVNLDTELAPAFTAHTREVYAAKVNPSVVPAHLEHTRAIYSPSVAGIVAVLPGFTEHTRATFAPTVNPQTRPGFTVHTREVYSPAVSPKVEVGFVTHARDIYSPNVVNVMLPALIAHGREVYSPLVSPQVRPGRIDHDRATYSPAVDDGTGPPPSFTRFRPEHPGAHDR